MSKIFRLGVYKHFTGELFNVRMVCKHSNTNEQLVIYHKLYGDATMLAQPMKMFTAKIPSDGKEINKYEYIKHPFGIVPNHSR